MTVSILANGIGGERREDGTTFFSVGRQGGGGRAAAPSGAGRWALPTPVIDGANSHFSLVLHVDA